MLNDYSVAVIGTGFAERVQIPGFKLHPRFRLVAVAGRDPDRTRQVAHRFEIERWYVDWCEMIGTERVDVLSIAAPPHLHREMVVAAFQAGLNVLCEKPMALNAQEARQMVDQWRQAGMTAMIDHEFRYLPAHLRFGELIRAGEIGELRRLVIRVHESWRADPTLKWNWWSDLARGGGLLGAMGSHYFDAVRHWFGAPTRVWGKLSVCIRHRQQGEGERCRAVTADDAFIAVFDLVDGAEVLFDFTALADPATGSRITAVGSEGTLVIVDGRTVLGPRGRGNLQPLEWKEAQPGNDEPWLLHPFLRLLDDLAGGLDEGTSPPPSFEDGLAHQEAIDAVRISSALGTWVNFPPSGSFSLKDPCGGVSTDGGRQASSTTNGG